MVVVRVAEGNEPEVDHEECPQCKGKGFVVEDLDEEVYKLPEYNFKNMGWSI
jgi:hypothetical protein